MQAAPVERRASLLACGLLCALLRTARSRGLLLARRSLCSLRARPCCWLPPPPSRARRLTRRTTARRVERLLQDIDIFPQLVQKSRYLSLSGCHAVGNGLRDPLGELIHVGGSVRAPTLGVNGADGWTRAKATAAARWWLPRRSDRLDAARRLRRLHARAALHRPDPAAGLPLTLPGTRCGPATIPFAERRNRGMEGRRGVWSGPRGPCRTRSRAWPRPSSAPRSRCWPRWRWSPPSYRHTARPGSVPRTDLRHL